MLVCCFQEEDQRLSKKFKVIEERAFLREKKTSKATLVESSSFDGDSSTHLRTPHTKEKMRRCEFH
jgi:hypothetical protein